MLRLTRSRPPAAIVAGLLLGLTACSDRAPTPRPSGAGPTIPAGRITLNVAAASDLEAAWPAIVARFAEASGFDAAPTFAASGNLAEQIRQGAPFDVFLSADLGFVEKLAASADVRPESVAPYALGELALVVRSELAGKVRSLADLTGPDVKSIAMANPDTAPYGRAARTALERSGLAEKLDAKLVRAESVRMALQYVAMSDADAGFVGRASIAGNPRVAVVALDPGLHDPIVQGLGITRQAANLPAAETFREFLLGEEGRALLLKAGYRLPEAARDR